ncbi:homocysteine-responsive endoplasmic reticulum-resident ubiquitin-like domain member 2 protein isoform X2 [Acropora millepora]|uniref:homocysteine-responsive endoplasmic reticulum-resident ubiquitin-like domain member 2 protein isoform X2 n=1 Tax=Acropora millepora TaxID=45264 RepID=UPI0010FCD72E|nr:homocysteine-responsive endoplasmic reticulum-resident ubiquitin-like domain member 2 protein isoform X2 [Acropora millepora]
MANLVFDSPVTLVVKTPNQKVDDLRIDCALEWSVEQLKRHLSRVYPTKPESQHQRLIYSGQLLNDNLILKDVLREHEEGKHHTVHLVCPMKIETMSSSQSPAVSSAHSLSSSQSENSVPTTPTTYPTDTGGLRYRGAHTQAYPPFNMYHQQMTNVPYNVAMAQGNGYVIPPFMLPPYWMQQMMAQQMAAGGMLPPNVNQQPNFGYPQMPFPWYPQAGNVPAPQVPFMTPPQTPTPPPPQAAHPAPAQAPQPQPAQPQPAQPQANDNVQANANAGPLFDDEEDEDNANRDWLDKIYTLCRIGVLLSIFWFYSSTSRFLLLVLTFVLIYLYQCGFFQIFLRNRGNNRQEIPFQEPEPQQGGEQRPAASADNEQQEDATDGQNGEDTPDNSDEPAVPPPPPGPSAATVAYNFITSFFTSLFPDGAAVQN